MISCCFCQNEFPTVYQGGGQDCDCDLNEMGHITCGYWSDYDDNRYFFYHKQKTFQIVNKQRKYRQMSLSEIEVKFQITPSRGEVGNYKYVVCNHCVKTLIEKRQILNKYDVTILPCALCGNEDVELYFFLNSEGKPILRNFSIPYKDAATFKADLVNYVKRRLPFKSPVVNGVKLLDDFMTVCNCCYFFYK